MATALPSGLIELREAIGRDLRLLGLPAKAWMPSRGEDIFDVAIVGGGMLGLAAAAALKLQGVSNIACFDAAEPGREGPWVTSARMVTLRTDKHATGPALGIPSLTFRAWFEAQYGAQAWDALDRIPRGQWMEYLLWYRDVLALPVHNNSRIVSVDPLSDDRGLIALRVAGDKRPRLARRVVLATGIDGMGEPTVPAFLNGVPRTYWAHSSDLIDAAGLAGKSVGVIGAGASAMDNASFAAESGASDVRLFVRRASLPSVDKFSGVSSAGLVLGYQGLPDATKWRLMKMGLEAPVPPPRPSVRRVASHPNVTLHLSSPVTGAREKDGKLEVETPKGIFALDMLICATGFRCAPAQRPELASFAAQILRWHDIFTPPAGEESDALGNAPYLAPDFSLVARGDEAGDALSRIHCFTFDAVLTHGKLTSGVPALSEAAQRLARGVIASLFREDREHHLGTFITYDRRELQGDEWPKEQIFA